MLESVSALLYDVSTYFAVTKLKRQENYAWMTFDYSCCPHIYTKLISGHFVLWTFLKSNRKGFLFPSSPFFLSLSFAWFVYRHFRMVAFSFLLATLIFYMNELDVNVFCCYSHNSHYVAVFRGFFRLFRQFFL